MDEILPGVLHWTARHPAIEADVSSYYVAASQALIDPLVEGREVDALGPVSHVICTIGLHGRSTTEFGVPVSVPVEGLHRWEDRDADLAPYEDGDEVAPGIRAHRVGGIAPDDYALHVEDAGALALGDALVHYGELRFVSDRLMGDDPEAVKRTTRARLRDLLDLEWDALLLAHGAPIPSGGKAALRDFLGA